MCYMILKNTILLNDKRHIYEIENEKSNCVFLHGKKIESDRNIIEISVTDELCIITTEYPLKRFDDYSCDKSNIDAYDWNGNHMWNISEITGEKTFFFGANLNTIDFVNYCKGVDISRCNKNHKFLLCQSLDSILYIIDLDERKVVHKLQSK